MKIAKRKLFVIAVGLLGIVLVLFGIFHFFLKNTIAVDGKNLPVYSLKKHTVKNILDTYQIKLNPKDIVHPDLNQTVWWGEEIEVIRVTESVDEKTETIDFILKWKRKTSQNLRKVEIQRGVRQIATWSVFHVFHNGREASSKKSLKKMVQTPVDRLAFLSDQGFPVKIYDLSKAKKLRVIATAYWLGDPQVPGDTTFSGHKVERGLVAVDPTVIPLGYRLYIPGYGYAYSSDTGSAIKGKRIDLFVENKEVSRTWEYTPVTVYILEKSKTW